MANIYNSLYRDISSGCETLDHIEILSKNAEIVKPSYVGIGINKEENVEITESKDGLPFFIYKRSDVISRYLGDSAHRATKALNNALGGVAYFDEAYNLCHTGGHDPYGEEALCLINEFMEDHADEIIFIFSGYKDKIFNGIFEIQSGLKSRFQQIYEIDGYTNDELYEIFKMDVEKLGWKLDVSADIRGIIGSYKFEYYGRDMNSLANFVDRIMSNQMYDNIMKSRDENLKVGEEEVRLAISEFMAKNIKGNEITSDMLLL